MPRKLKRLWRCPRCGERFVTRNLWHSCGKHTYKEIFARSEPHVAKLFRKFAAMVRKCGPVRIYPQKTRIVCMTRVRFAGCYPRKSHLLRLCAATKTGRPPICPHHRVRAALHRSPLPRRFRVRYVECGT